MYGNNSQYMDMQFPDSDLISGLALARGWCFPLLNHRYL